MIREIVYFGAKRKSRLLRWRARFGSDINEAAARQREKNALRQTPREAKIKKTEDEEDEERRR